MQTAHQVACYLAGLNKKAGKDPINFSKMNTLLYYSQGHHLAKNGTPLFSDEIKRGENHPIVLDEKQFEKVVPMIYLDEKLVAKFRETDYDGDLFKQYATGRGIEDYDLAMEVEDLSAFCLEKNWLEWQAYEIHFQRNMRDKNYSEITQWYFDTPNHPFEIWLEKEMDHSMRISGMRN